jgi:hypothetical protein
MKPGCKLAETFKEGYGSKRVVLPMMMLTMTVMMMIMKLNMIIQIFRKYKRAILH